MWTDSRLQIVNDSDQYVGADGTTYPANFPKAEIPGLFPVTPTARPDDALNSVHGFSIDESHAQVWSFTPLTDAQLAVSKAEAKKEHIVSIDADVDAIYEAVMGNRASEYALAEQDAKDFKAAAYVGDVPASVSAWATAKGQTAQWAADDILATAALWRSAQAAIRTNRLGAKEAVRNATTQDATTTAMQAWAAFRTYIRGQLAI